MKIKRFVAPDMRSAIRQVREDQGPDAVILSNRSINGGIEIIAAVDYDEALVNQAVGGGAAPRSTDERTPSRDRGAGPGRQKSVAPSYAELAAAYEEAHGEDMSEEDERAWLAGLSDELDSEVELPGEQAQAPEVAVPEATAARERPRRRIPENPYGGEAERDFDVPSASEGQAGNDAGRIVWSQEPNLMEVRRELSSVRSMLQSQFSNLAWDRLSRERPIKATVLRELSAMGIEPDLARQILEEMPHTEDEQQAWRLPLGLLARRVPVGDDPILEKGGRVALVGPTGVGKTTTIAKLAARFALRHGKRHVALITTDHYRVGGQEQLHSYGRILGVPVFSVDTAKELQDTLEGAGQ